LKQPLASAYALHLYESHRLYISDQSLGDLGSGKPLEDSEVLLVTLEEECYFFRMITIV